MPEGRSTETPRLVAVTGVRNAGKTTAVECIARELTARGYRVGTLKHCHCGFDLDTRGKDSWRHRQAGSVRTVLTGPGGFAVLGDAPSEKDPRLLAEWLFPDVDLVLAEGYHWLPLHRIEVEDASGSVRPADPGGVVVGRLPGRFDLWLVRDLCDRIELQYLVTLDPIKTDSFQAVES